MEINNLKDNLDDVFIDPKTLHKNAQIYHSSGNKIDYSTSRFHSIVVIKHDEELKDKYINAHEKAQIEIEKTKGRMKTKEKSLDKFNKDMNVNSVEIQKKMKAKDNLKKLEENLKVMRVKKVVNTSKKIYEKEVIFNLIKNNIKKVEGNSSFTLDKRLELLSQICNENNQIAQNNIKKTYNEPVTRELPVSEYIPRLNPVDIKEYITEEENASCSNFHVTHKNSFSQNNMPQRDLYSLKEIENILNVGNLLNKEEKENSIRNYNKEEKEIGKMQMEIEEKIKRNVEPEKKVKSEKIVEKNTFKNKNKLKGNYQEKSDDSHSIMNLLNDKVDKKENKEKAGNLVNDFFNSIIKSEVKNNEILNKQIKENEKIINSNNKQLQNYEDNKFNMKLQKPNEIIYKEPYKKGEMIELDFKTNNNLTEKVNEKKKDKLIKPIEIINKEPYKKGEMIEFDFKTNNIITEKAKEKIKDKFIKEREKVFEDFKKQKDNDDEENEIVVQPIEEKYSKEALFLKRKEMIKKRDFKKKK